MHLVRLLLGRLGTQFLNEKMKRKKQNRKTNNLGSTVLCADKFNSIFCVKQVIGFDIISNL